MKLLLCFGALATLCAFAMANNKDEKAEYLKIVSGCIKSSGVNLEDIKKPPKEFLDDPKYMDYMICMSTAMGLLDKTGKMVPEMLKNAPSMHFDLKKVDEHIRKCENVKGSSPHDTAYATLMCMRTLSLSKTVHKEGSAKHDQITAACIKSSGVKIEDINKALKKEFVDDHKMADFVFCVLTARGVVEKTGKIIPALYKQIAPRGMEELVNDQIKKCENEKGSSPEDTAYAVFKCMGAQIKPFIFSGF